VKSVALSSAEHLSGTSKPRRIDRLARRIVLSRLGRLHRGRLELVENGRTVAFGASADDTDEFSVRVDVLDPAFFSDIAFGGSIGAGEAYMQGYWRCDDPVALVRLLLRNRNVLEDMESGTARLTAPVQKLFHWINRNTRDGARRNIAAHYDLGNDFFRLWLDDSMMYSSAIFPHEGATLAEAQFHRLEEICRKLDLGPDDHVVEIGTGWGGFAIHAAGRYGCRVTTTTISGEQFDEAAGRIADAGLTDRITLLRDDFRDLEGRYDKLVSIEMIEAIGSALYDEYFAKCAELLKPGGKLLIQAITIADQRYEEYRRGVDFIRRYIFPGSGLPSLSAMVESTVRATPLRITGVDDIGLHYATTLAHWRRNFFAHLDAVRAQGYPEPFIRMWEYYLCYCEGAFAERAISDVHFMAERPAY
jgi:cyclopropane-fatty-acyl-phospholipid synthase